VLIATPGATLNLSHLTIEHCNASDGAGGGVNADGTLNVNDCTSANNNGTYGGANI